MLLRFGFSNFKSIKDYQEISFIASSLSDDCADLISSEHIKEKALPGIAIYGGNATGKSNALKALEFICRQILYSHTSGNASGGIVRDYFLMDKASQDEPSLFDCDFILNSIHYHYGFSINSERVVEEWLYAYPKKHRQVWFHRNINEEKVFHFGKNLKGRNSIIESLTRNNSLFLSCAAQNNHEMLTPVYDYFKNTIEFDLGGNIDTFKSDLTNKEEMSWLISFLSSADIGIVDIIVERDKTNITQANTSTIAPPLIEQFQKRINKSNATINSVNVFVASDYIERISKPSAQENITIAHSCNDGSTIAFKLDQESLGTLKLIGLLGPVYNALKQGTLLVVDEMDTSLHPLLSRKIIQLFQSEKTNPDSAQLLFSTHDTNLLAGNFLRRDQIWFTEKNDCGATDIYPLSDISTRKGDNIESGYLQGRYGAIPFLGNIDSLFDEAGN